MTATTTTATTTAEITATQIATTEIIETSIQTTKSIEAVHQVNAIETIIIIKPTEQRNAVTKKG